MSAWARVFLIFSIMIAGVGTARAESLPRMIPRLIEESGWLKRQDPSKVPERPDLRVDPVVPHLWLGDALHLSVLARDWKEAYSITDGRSLVFDRIRMIRSSRMAVWRLSIVGGRFVPFAEVSAGQWRIDPELMPKLPRDTELAAQLAAGFEVTIAPRCAFAFDVEQTSIYRDARSSLPMVNVLGTFAALRSEF